LAPTPQGVADSPLAVGERVLKRGHNDELANRVAREAASGTLSVVAMNDAPQMHNSIVVYRRRDAGAPEGIVAAFLKLIETRG